MAIPVGIDFDTLTECEVPSWLMHGGSCAAAAATTADFHVNAVNVGEPFSKLKFAETRAAYKYVNLKRNKTMLHCRCPGVALVKNVHLSQRHSLN